MHVTLQQQMIWGERYAHIDLMACQLEQIITAPCRVASQRAIALIPLSVVEILMLHTNLLHTRATLPHTLATQRDAGVPTELAKNITLIHPHMQMLEALEALACAVALVVDVLFSRGHLQA